MIKRLLRRVFRKNWGLKLFSLAMAILLWLILVPTEKVAVEKVMTLPLETYNIPPNMELVEKPLPTVDVTIRAPNRLMNQITAKNPTVLLNLESASAYQQDYPLSPAMINLPSGADVVRLYPNRVHLRLEETTSAMLEVVPDIIQNSLRAGYRLTAVEVDPDRVLVKGPKSKLSERDKVRTVPIDLAPYTGTTEIEADVILPRPELRLAANQTKVRVRLTIAGRGLPAANPAARH